MKMPKVGFVVLTMLFLQSIALAGTWTEDFGSGRVDDWDEVVGEWKVKEGAYCETARTLYAKTMWGDIDWADYTVEVDVTLVEAVGSDCAGIVIRADEEANNGFRFWIRTSGNRAQFSKWRDDTFTHVENFGTIPLDVKVGETYHLKVVLEGQRYQCFVNGEQLVDYEDPEKFRSDGKIGFMCYEAYPAFDNLVITGPGIPNNVAVEPEGKLASCWGKIKYL